MVLLWNVSPPQNLRHCKQDRGLRWTRGGAFSRRWSSEANRANVAACEGLCEALAERVASVGLWDTAGRVRPVWTKVDEGVLRGYLQRENSMGSGTAAAVLWVKSGSFGQPKKVQDKGRWSLATTSRPQSPAVRGFPGLWYRRRFSRFRSFSAVVGLRGATVSSSSGVFHRRCELRGFFG